MDVVNGNRPQFPLMKELVETAYRAIEQLEYGQMINYEELHQAMQVDPQATRTRTAILRAGKRLLRERDKLLVNVRAVGYQVCKPTEQAVECEKQRRFARRRLKKGLAAVTFIRMENMSAEEINKVLTEQARTAILIGTDRRLSRQKSLPKRSDIALPSGRELVDIFSKTKKNTH